MPYLSICSSCVAMAHPGMLCLCFEYMAEPSPTGAMPLLGDAWKVNRAIKPYLGIWVHQIFPADGALVAVTTLVVSEETAPPAHLFAIWEVDREGQRSAGIKGDGVCFRH